jgi:hypothetical protein
LFLTSTAYAAPLSGVATTIIIHVIFYLERDEAVVAEVEALQVLEVPQARHLHHTQHNKG